MTREDALKLLKEKLDNPNLVNHCMATEAIMRSLAQLLDEDEEKWALAGLLHDLDFEETKDNPERHGLRAAEILAEHDVDEEIIDAIKAHNADALGLERKSKLHHALASSESITGLIAATALVQPDKKIANVKPQSVIKRMKKKDFARNVDRGIIRECEKLGIDLPRFVEISLEAMNGVSGEIGL